MKRSHPFLTQGGAQPSRKREKYQFEITIKSLTDIKTPGNYYIKWKRGNKHMGKSEAVEEKNAAVELETKMTFVSSLFLAATGKKFKKKYMYIKIYRNNESKSCGSTNINLGSLIKSMDAETQNIMLQYKIKGKLKSSKLILSAKITYIRRSNNTFTDPTTMTDATDMSLDEDDDEDEDEHVMGGGLLSVDSSHIKNATITPVHTPTSPKINVPAGPDVGSPKIFSPSSQKNSARMRALLKMRGNKARRAYNASISFEEDDNAFQALSKRLKQPSRELEQSPLMSTPSQSTPAKMSSDEETEQQHSGTKKFNLNNDEDDEKKANLNKLLLKKRKQMELSNQQKQFVSDLLEKCPKTIENEIILMSSLIAKAFSHWKLFERDNLNIGDLLFQSIEEKIEKASTLQDVLFYYAMLRQLAIILKTEFQVKKTFHTTINEELADSVNPSISEPLKAHAKLFTVQSNFADQVVAEEKESFSLYESPLNAFSTKLSIVLRQTFMKVVKLATAPFEDHLKNFLFIDNMACSENEYTITTLLAHFSEVLKECEHLSMDRAFTMMLLHQLFYSVASTTLTFLFQPQSPYCSMKSSIYLKMNLTQLELWGEANAFSEPLAQFRLIRDALNVLMMNKANVATDYKSICPLLNISQIHHLFDAYTTDEFDPDGIPSGVRSMLPKKKENESLLPPYHGTLLFIPSMMDDNTTVSSFWKMTKSPFGEAYDFL